MFTITWRMGIYDGNPNCKVNYKLKMILLRYLICLCVLFVLSYLFIFFKFRSYADARVQTIYGGTNEVMKDLIARTIVAKPGR